MGQRIDYYNRAPEALKIVMAMKKYFNGTEIDKKIRDLIKARASQINGSAFCLNIHINDAREMGETEQRLYCISAWRDSDFYSDAEKMDLELTEHITLIPTMHVPNELYNRVREQFDKRDYIDLVLIIKQINS